MAAPRDDLDKLAGKARAHYEAQDMIAACKAIDLAARKVPDNPAIAFMQAQFAFEGWYEAVPLFERAARLNPGNADLVRNFVLALAAEGQRDRAVKLLEGLLARNPGWIEGLNVLATLRSTAGEEDFARGFADAASQQPGNTAVYLAWLHKLAAAKDWEGARRVLARADKHVPQAMRLARLHLECETGAAPADPSIFDGLAANDDPGLALLQIRHALRNDDPHRALGIAEAQLGTAHEGQFWPYCSLCWRLLDDRRTGWLDGDPPFAAGIDLEFEAGELDALAQFLRSLHTMNAPYPEQSVRGGTQTDRNLLLHHDPRIGKLRRMIEMAVVGWRDKLPDPQKRHPLLSRKPAQILFSGSWSVRLAGGGHHSAHTHPMGWASSALYIAVPQDMGEDHAGELAIGIPPPELELGLQPTTYFKPKDGRLVLFPSTSWHGTVPFEGEERLTVAFDVASGISGKEGRHG